MNLDRYLRRIGYTGPRSTTVEVLNAVHRAHATTIAYENLDVYLERRVSIDVGEAFEKIVERGRGGWCYENNGLLGWALVELGFAVTRVAGAVMRSEFPSSPLGGHLVLRVDLANDHVPRIADVGLGGALIEPIPLLEGEHRQGWRTFHLSRLDDGEWRFHNTAGGEPRDFDFAVTPTDDATLTTNCDWLQDNEASTFRLNLVAGAIGHDGGYRLTGRTLTETRSGDKHLIGSETELIAVLTDRLGVQVPSNVDGLWARVTQRHRQLFGDE